MAQKWKMTAIPTATCITMQLLLKEMKTNSWRENTFGNDIFLSYPNLNFVSLPARYISCVLFPTQQNFLILSLCRSSHYALYTQTITLSVEQNQYTLYFKKKQVQVSAICKPSSGCTANQRGNIKHA